MESLLTLNSNCTPSEAIVAREIEGALIINPLAAGIGDMEDELYTLNETGKVIWGLLDGNRSLAQIAEELGEQYDAPAADIEADVLGLAGELARRKIVVVK